MKKNTWVGIGVVFSLCFANVSFSAPAKVKPRARVAAPAPLEYDESDWYLFLGADLGGSSYSVYKNSGTEAPRSGTDLGVRALLAHYWHNWVADGGLGFNFISNKGTNSDKSVNTDRTNNAYVDLSARYRLGQHWQLGPEFEYWLSTDKGLNPTITGSDLIAETSNTAAFLGATLLYEWTKENKVRLGARYLTAMNVDSRSVSVYQAFVQIGFDVFGSSHEEAPVRHYEQVNADDLDRAEVRSNEEPLPMATPYPTPEAPMPEPVVMSTPSMPEPEATPTPIPTPEPAPIVERAAPKVVVTLDTNDLPFGFNNDQLPPANAARVRKIGAFLKQHNGAWKKLLVSGHTDERGTNDYNMRLSQKRAQAVKKLLVAGGASGSKIKAVGMGETEPKDKRHNEKAWAKNRRVELEFFGVKDTVLIRKAGAQ